MVYYIDKEAMRNVIREQELQHNLKGLGWVEMAMDKLPTIPAPQWISVEDRMPIEYESVFKKFKSTPKWLAGMYETISNDVNAVVKFEDGTKKVYTLHTADGKWSHLPILGKPIVTHWMPLPKLPEVGHHEY